MQRLQRNDDWFIFFEDGAREIVTVISEPYSTIDNDFLLPQFRELGFKDMWFQQNRKPIHSLCATLVLEIDTGPQDCLFFL